MRSLHLAHRFFSSVVARPLSADERAWVKSVLTPGELAVWARQPRYDLRHSHGVARRVERALGPDADTRWLAAALLHDAGKAEAKLGLVGRVLATLTMMVAGRRKVAGWAAEPGWRGRFGRYADHGPIGARLLRDAGGRAEPARWAEIHHLVNSDHPGTGLELPQPVVVALRDCDHD